MDSPGRPPSLAPSGRSVVVIGAGLVGLSCAWLLARRGDQVLLLDGSPVSGGPAAADPLADRGSEAALGVLMGRVFHRSSGRGWRLRQRSLALWAGWRAELATRGRLIPWRPGLLLLAAGAEDLERQRLLLQDHRRREFRLASWDRQRLEALDPLVPAQALSGLYSPEDGQLDPLAAMAALAADAVEAGMERRAGWAEALERCGLGWRVRLRGGEPLEAEWVVLAAGLGSGAPLLNGQPLPMPPLEPVLGQALELALDLDPAAMTSPGRWPGAVVWRGMNLILRAPDDGAAAAASWRLWLGATLEPGQQASEQDLEQLRVLGGEAPDWVLQARICRRWQGLRARPMGQPAPLLQELAPGVLLAAGHYRNGVLLAPASAEWIAGRIGGEADAA